MRKAAHAALLAGSLCAFVPAAVAEPAGSGADRVAGLIEAGRAEEAERLARALLAGEAASPAGLAELNRLLGDALFEQKRYAEAEPHFRAALSLRERLFASDSVEVAASAADLGFTLRALGRHREAEPHYRRALDIRRRALGEEHADTARAWSGLSNLLDQQGRYGEAADAKARAVAAGRAAFGASDPQTVAWQGERAAMLHDAGRLAEAEDAYRAAIEAAPAAFAAGDLRLATMRQGLANLLAATGRGAEAVPAYRQALEARMAGLGPVHAATAASLERLAGVLLALDDAPEAASLFGQLLDIRRRLDGPASEGVARAFRGAGRAAERLRRRAEAEAAYRGALDISRQLHGPDSAAAAFDGVMLGLLYAGQMRVEEAGPLLRGAVSVLERDAATAAGAISARTALALMEEASGRGDEAVALVERSLRELEASGRGGGEAADLMVLLADLHRRAGRLDAGERSALAALDILDATAAGEARVLRARGSFARIRLDQGRAAEALAMFEERLARAVLRYGDDRPETLVALADVGRARFALGDLEGAAEAFGSYAEAVERLAAIDAAAAFDIRTGALEDQAISHAAVFDFLVKTRYRLAELHPEQAEDHAAAAFTTAQRVIESRAASAMAQAAARAAAGDERLAALARERQDLVEAWQREDRALVAMLATPEPDMAAVAALRERLAAHDGRIRRLDADLAAAFPEFAGLHNPSASSLDEARAGLAPGQVLLFFADTTALGDVAAETYLWAVTADGPVRWVRIGRDSGELAAAVRHLRDMLGVGPLTRGATALTSTSRATRADEVIEAGSRIHDALLGPVSDLLAGRELVVVPSQSLAELPFHLLVAERAPDGAADPYRETGWLVRDHAITVLPTVWALAAPGPDAGRRGEAEPAEPYLGFANPLLSGRDGSDLRAFARSGCEAERGPDASGPGDVLPVAAALYRGGAADVDAVRRLAPLPETLDEACAIAELLGAGPEAVIQGAEATEEAIKRLSAEGRLSRAQVLHFATHGLVAGELSALAEPAIVLSPPDAASPEDDGLLTASEVAALRLDADWVILSACNTAAGDGGGEALSGLSRAFLYAGARSLLVSHWPVNSDAAVRLVTEAVGELAADPGIGRAEALRRAMLAEIDRGGRYADPGNWAPFVLIGAG